MLYIHIIAVKYVFKPMVTMYSYTYLQYYVERASDFHGSYTQLM